MLVVDDDETVGRFMRELLETWGLQAVCLHRPEAALELIRAEPSRFDVLITDQSMPKMSGMELAQRIRQFHDDLPIILYSGHGDGLAGDERRRGRTVCGHAQADRSGRAAPGH